jgi:site-specific DNA recombinase
MKANLGPKGIRPLAAIYARVSLEEQGANYSLASQQRGCEKLAIEKGYRISKDATFIDQGGLGGELDRAGLTRLREAVRSGLIQAVICFDPDRLSRKLAHLLLLTEELEKAGVPLLFVNGAVDQTPEGRMMLSLRGAFAEFEKTKFAERVSRGRREKAQQGHVVGSRPPFGYQYRGRAQGVRGELVIDEAQAAVVRRIFKLADGGKRAIEIARILHQDDVPTYTGARWAKQTIAGILRAEVYTGVHYYNRRAGAVPRTRRVAPRPGQSKKTSQTWRDRSEWISGQVPPIVSPELFNRVREQVARSAALNVGRPARQYVLRGLIKCALCGRACLVYLSHGRAEYRCSHRDPLTAQRLCRGKSTPVPVVEEIVWERVSEAFADAGAFLREYSAHARVAARAARDSDKRRAALEREIFKLRQREQRAARELLDSELANAHAAFRADLKATAAKRQQAERELQALQSVAAVPAFDPVLFDRFAERVKAADTPELRRAVLLEVVPQVRLSDDEIQVDIARPAILLSPGATAPDDSGINRFSSQPAAGEGRSASARDRGTAGDRRRALARSPAASSGKPLAVDFRSRAGDRVGMAHQPRLAGSVLDRSAARRLRLDSKLARPRIYLCAGSRDGDSVRSRSRASNDQSGSGARAQGRFQGRPFALAAAFIARKCPSGVISPPLNRSRTFRSDSQKPSGPRSRIQPPRRIAGGSGGAPDSFPAGVPGRIAECSRGGFRERFHAHPLERVDVDGTRGPQGAAHSPKRQHLLHWGGASLLRDPPNAARGRPRIYGT